MTPLAEAGSALLGGVLQSCRTLHGGDLSNVMLIALRDGREAVIKTGPAPRTEAAMLRAIAAAPAPAPVVLAVDDAILALEFVPDAGPPGGAWADLGARLAALHRVTGAEYGWPQDYAFADLAIENGACRDWANFYAERRLLVHAPHIAADLARRVERLARSIGEHLPAHPRAALLHGDLWSGNVLARGDRIAAFIDPACLFGHTEIDLAMIGLFDTPGAEFQAAYGGPEPGAQARRPIYRLWPALVHLRLFGGSYRRMVEGFLAAAGV